MEKPNLLLNDGITEADILWLSSTDFQDQFCKGKINYSCNHLQGKAANYRETYVKSLDRLLERLERHGYEICIHTDENNFKIVAISRGTTK